MALVHHLTPPFLRIGRKQLDIVVRCFQNLISALAHHDVGLIFVGNGLQHLLFAVVVQPDVYTRTLIEPHLVINPFKHHFQGLLPGSKEIFRLQKSVVQVEHVHVNGTTAEVSISLLRRV
jgi:hypothetical protein